MLFQPSNIAPSTLSGIGIGTVDVTQGIDVSWQVNGDSPMTDYSITIYQNDSGSTQMYTTGKITLGTPFQTHDAQGNPQFFSTKISAATLSTAGIVNGYANGYKLIIKQWWSANDSVEQTSAAVFITRTTPTLSIDAIPNPVTSNSLTITATYAQAEGDPISTVEWIFALAGHEDDPIKQTGAVTTQVLSFNADGLLDNTTYSIECNVVTANGAYVSTGFVQFSVSYSITAETIDFIVGQVKASNGVYLMWDQMSGVGITTYDVYRKEDGVPYLKKVGSVAATDPEIIDYAVASQTTVKYVVIGTDGTNSISIAESGNITPRFWDYSILLCNLGQDNAYHVRAEYRFGLGVETGAVSNNNAPTMQTNFTRYPNRQPISSSYKSGSLKSYIGAADSLNQYSDSISLQDAIFAISTSTLTKFLKTRKGEVLMVDTESPISMQTLDSSYLQPLNATIGWVEIGETSGLSIISKTSDAFWPISGKNQVYVVRFQIDNDTGNLMVDASDSLNDVASFAVDTSTGELKVTADETLSNELIFGIDENNGTIEIIRK